MVLFSIFSCNFLVDYENNENPSGNNASEDTDNSVILSSLVAFYNPEDTGTWEDQSSNSNSSDFNGSSDTTYFDGIYDYVSFGKISREWMISSSPCTIVSKVKYRNETGRLFCAWGDYSADSNYRIKLELHENGLFSSSTENYVSDYILIDEQIYVVSWVYDGNGLLKSYLDGNLVSTNNVSIRDKNSKVYIAGDLHNQRFSQMNVYNFSVFSSALDSNTISTISNSDGDVLNLSEVD